MEIFELSEHKYYLVSEGKFEMSLVNFKDFASLNCSIT